MKPILLAKSAATLDKELIKKYFLSEEKLIDSAARCVVEEAQRYIKGETCVLVGPGNNGSDGLAIAQILREKGYSVSVCYLSDKANEENRRRRKLNKVPVVSSPKSFDTVFDALFGFSFHGEADDRTKALIGEIGEESFVIAVDVPSASLVSSSLTVSLMCLKADLYLPSAREKAGKIVVRNPGFPEEEIKSSDKMFLIERGELDIKKMSLSSYKNTRGHLLIIGGSDKYRGAVRLAANAAFHSGVGLVTCMTESALIANENPSIMFHDKKEGFEKYDAVVIGPGWEESDGEIYTKAVSASKAIVVDASALTFVPNHIFSSPAVITPHIGEYRRIMEKMNLKSGLESAASLSSSLRTLAKKINAVVVLKASVVWVTKGEEIYIYDGANPTLGTAGSGDVLSGVIGALLSRDKDPLKAALNSVIIHQEAGREAGDKYGFYSAEELILEIGSLLKKELLP